MLLSEFFLTTFLDYCICVYIHMVYAFGCDCLCVLDTFRVMALSDRKRKTPNEVENDPKRVENTPPSVVKTVFTAVNGFGGPVGL